MAAKTEEDRIRERVSQGLQQRKHCGLCEQVFFVDELPGAITYKSILELREKWRRENASNGELSQTQVAERSSSPQKESAFSRLYTVKAPAKTVMPSPSRLYKRVELCIFCMQFFDVDGVPPPANDSTADGKNATFRSQSPRTAGNTSRY